MNSYDVIVIRCMCLGEPCIGSAGPPGAPSDLS
jgi:hypothetical protein